MYVRYMLDICYIFRSQIRDIFRSQIWDLLRPQTRDAFNNNSPNHLAYTHVCVCVCVCARARARVYVLYTLCEDFAGSPDRGVHTLKPLPPD